MKATFDANMSLSAWNHITCIVSGDYVTVYVNGKNLGSQNISAAIGGVTAGDLCIGKHTDGSGKFSYDTYFDEFMYFDRCISAEEVKQIYEYYTQN